MKAVAKPMPKAGAHWSHFMMASLLVGAALFKAGVPALPIVLAIAGCGVWNLRRKP
jgi:hypothetical protein